jgi:glycosyltransferase involved in cell wall biosynthesis
VCLAMIVRDEAANAEGLAGSVRDLIDRWVICDTGSDDATPEVFQEALDPIPGELHRCEWRNFRDNRTELMELARGRADYLLLLDADMRPRFPNPLPALTADVYHGRILGSLDYTLPILVRGDRPWRYEGVAHSYLACDEPYSETVLPGLEIQDGSHTTVEKLRRDLETLSAEHARNPLDARTAFYLAQTYSDLDMIPEAIQAYRVRAHLDGWDEETYVARQRLGALLCEHVSFSKGARELLAAWEMRPGRAEALRALANVADNVADKIPYPADRLFVRRAAYANPPAVTVAVPPRPPLEPQPRRPVERLGYDDVTAIVVTRGDVDLAPILDPIPFGETVIWNNADRPYDYKTFGRYAAIPEATRPVVFWVDDDVVFSAFDELLAAYRPGRLVSNMDEPWIVACGYRNLVGMQGAGSLCDSHLPAETFGRYLAEHPFDDDLLTEADFVFGVLCPFDVVDLGYRALDYADAPGRLYRTPGQHERKWAMIERCRAMLATA